MNYDSYIMLPSKRASLYDFVLIDGLCRQYTAYYVCPILIILGWSRVDIGAINQS